MTDEWQVAEGNGWIPLKGFGLINPRRDGFDGGRQYFTGKLENDEYATAMGPGISGGPDTWEYEYDQPFYMANIRGEHCIEVEISPLGGGRYAVKYRPGSWLNGGAGGW
ncbi:MULTISPECIES: hypothetical protein [Clavibacter]|uniref:Uncharacterized protein n=2 Tax=Clavibacter TaxID=1573 RepID=A0A399NVL3_9MICO|nr:MULTISPECIES: hypothetical protein [Clavibacter]KDP89660.1 hypothetical protein W824_15940 [Clavibacter cf. michiganensis LMG 26808]RII98195.1 hypothetical protein DZF96_04170 [Clavibacter michiganensis]UKF24358.1 hypothetical protein KYT88_11555 [Clavibacter sp. A6099]